jgi:hypothetical protein
MIFSKGSKLHIIDGDTKYTYLIRDASLGQNIREASYSRNTIHSTNLVDYSFPDTKGPVSISIGMQLGRQETYLFNWLGLLPVFTGEIITAFKIDPSYRQDLSTAPTLYLEGLGGTYKVSSAVLLTCSFQIGPKKVTSVDLSGQGAELTRVTEIPTTLSTITQSSSTFYSSSLQVQGIDRLSTITLEYTRDVSWVGSKGIHEVGSVTLPSSPVVTRFSLSGTITCYTPKVPLYWESQNERVVIQDSSFSIELDSCMTSTRLNTSGPVHTTMLDYKLNPNNNSYINIL